MVSSNAWYANSSMPNMLHANRDDSLQLHFDISKIRRGDEEYSELTIVGFISLPLFTTCYKIRLVMFFQHINTLHGTENYIGAPKELSNMLFTTKQLPFSVTDWSNV